VFEGFDGKRLLAMVPQEVRWMDNLKKAFYESDIAFADGKAADDAFPALCKAVDVAATLHSSLQHSVASWSPPPQKDNKRKFTEFLRSEIPGTDENGDDIDLIDARTQKPVQYDFADIFYAIRCMIHENENLNDAEQPDYHVTLDWSIPEHGDLGYQCDGRLTCNAKAFWWRVRSVVAKFILGTESFMAYERGDTSGTIHSHPAFKSVHPNDGRHTIKTS